MQRLTTLLFLPIALGVFTGVVMTGCPGTEPKVVEPAATESEMPDVKGLKTLEDENAEIGVVEYTLEVDIDEVQLLPNTGRTQVWAYNGIVPGPLMQARVGEIVRVHVTNHLQEPTTIHWHGLRIDHRMDGVVHGSLPAIAPGETFTYEFTPPDAGTYWYHPHMRTTVQVERGLFGMLIVHEREENRPDVDADRAFVLDDIRLNDNGSIAPFAASGMDIIHGRSGNVLTVNGQIDPVYVSIAEGGVERWRLVNTSNAREMLFQFPGLEVRQIGSDGGLWAQEFTRFVDEISLPVGARAELEVRMPEGSTRGTLNSMVITQNAVGELQLSPFPMADVQRASTPIDAPKAGHVVDLPYEKITARADVDERFELEAYLNAQNQVEMSVNGAAYPDAPIWKVKQGELKIMKITNRMPQNGHPFHLHGQFFHIIERDGVPTDDEPGWRDTAMIPAGSGKSITIATYFDNPGTWMYHCHILEHAEAGMMALLEVEPADEH